MRSDRVVFLKPVIDSHTSFGQRAEQPSIQTGRANDRIDALAVGILPRTAWIDVMRVHVLFLQPFLHRLRNRFRAIVAAQTRRSPMLVKQSIENANNALRSQTTANGYLEALACELVNHGHALQLPSILSSIKNKIVPPNCPT